MDVIEIVEDSNMAYEHHFLIPVNYVYPLENPTDEA
jgi:hypothetical protein